jgi:ATP/maltotriose-dependent transcriptional regulator MalT
MRARDLCERIGASRQLFDALRGLWSNRYNQGDFRHCLTLTTKLIALAEELGGGLIKSIALRAHASTNLSMDRFVEARRAYEGAIATADVSDMSQSVALYGENPAISARIMLGQVKAFGGRLDSALEMVTGAETLARRDDQPISVVQVAAVRSIVALLRRDYARCLEAAEEEASVSLEHGFVHWHAHSVLMTGVARVFTQGEAGSLEIAARGIDNWKATGARLYVPTFCAYLADCALHCGRLDMARAAVDDGIAHAEANHERLVLSELQRLDALIYERSGADDVALARLDTSLATAARQGAWLFHLRGCTDRVRILADRALPAKAALEELRAALDRIEEFRSGPDWQRGNETLKKAAMRTNNGIL